MKALFAARNKAGVNGHHAQASGVPDGKILANLTLGFWVYLTEPLRANIIWNPALGNLNTIPSRAWMHDRMLKLGDLRNRVAHMEPLIGHTSSLAHNLVRIDEILSVMVEPDALAWISHTSKVPALFREGVSRGVLSAPASTYLGHTLA